MFSPSIYKLVKPKSEANSGASTPTRLPESNKSAINVTDNLLNIPPAAFGNDNGKNELFGLIFRFKNIFSRCKCYK